MVHTFLQYYSVKNTVNRKFGTVNSTVLVLKELRCTVNKASSIGVQLVKLWGVMIRHFVYWSLDDVPSGLVSRSLIGWYPHPVDSRSVIGWWRSRGLTSLPVDLESQQELTSLSHQSATGKLNRVGRHQVSWSEPEVTWPENKMADHDSSKRNQLHTYTTIAP